MKEYLERLHTETRFCHLFSHGELLDLLRDFGILHRFDYTIELFNIFELVFNNAVFALLSEETNLSITVSTYQFERLNHMLLRMDASGISTLIGEAVTNLQQRININDARMINYMNQCSDRLVQRLIHAARHDSLRAVIVTRQEEKIVPMSISFNPGVAMRDLELRNLIDELSQCGHNRERALLIKSRLRSLHDYLDLLESGTLYGDDFDELFELFGPTELAVLAKIVLYEELRSDTTDLATIIRSRPEQTDEEPWKSRFVTHMQQLDQERLQSIGHLIDRMDYEEINLA